MVPRDWPPSPRGDARRRALGHRCVFEAPRAVSAVSKLLAEGSGSGEKQQPPVTGKILTTSNTNAKNFHHNYADPINTTFLIGGLPASQKASILTNKINSHATLNETHGNISRHGVSSEYSSNNCSLKTDESDFANVRFNSNSTSDSGKNFYRMCNFVSETAATHREHVTEQIKPINYNHRVEWHFALSQHRDMFISLTDACAASVLHEGVRDGLIALLEHAEENLSCRRCIVAVPRNAKNKVALLKALMFLGFASLSSERVPTEFQEDSLMFVCYTFDE